MVQCPLGPGGTDLHSRVLTRALGEHAMQDDGFTGSLDPSTTETVRIVTPQPSAIAATRMEFSARTHNGLVRTNNEDQYLVVRLRKSLDLLDTSLLPHDLPQLGDQEGHVLLVADGIGGRAGGERASAMV